MEKVLPCKKPRVCCVTKKGGEFRFVYLPLNAIVDALSKKARDVIFPDGKDKSVKINQKVKFKIYDPTGKLEEGIGIGVNRDVYSNVWLELMDSLFAGSNERVPYVRHYLYFEE